MCRAVQGKGRSSSEADRYQCLAGAIQILVDFGIKSRDLGLYPDHMYSIKRPVCFSQAVLLQPTEILGLSG